MNRIETTKESNLSSITQKVEALLATMSVMEKAGQMTQITLDMLLEGAVYQVKVPHQINTEKLKTALVKYQVGSILNVAGIPYTREEWLELLSVIQSTITSESRLRVPIIYGIDAVHGANYTIGATLFPQQIGMAASWNPVLVEEAARITAYETRACGIPWNFSPVLDVCRQPLWSRMWETFGEDVYLGNVLGRAMVRGYQNTDVSHPERVAACLKHFLGYGMPLNGKDRTPAWIPERFLREYYLPPFREAIVAGAKTIMVNSAEINGIPVHVNYRLLTDILRNELGFTGVIVTDWEDIKYLHSRHRVAESHKEAVRMAIEAGVDMSMVPDDFSFTEHLVELVEEGSLSESRLDESVRRILQLKYELGLFEQAIPAKARSYPQFGSEAHRQVAQQLAEESITLVKNDDQQLPWTQDQHILVTGCTAHSMRFLNGGWSYTWQGERTDDYTPGELTVLDALRAQLGTTQVSYVPGCTFDALLDVSEAIARAKQADRILLCLGEEPYAEFHGNTNDLNLPPAQIQLAEAMIKTGKPVTLLLLEGRPRIISAFADELKSILLAYLPGNQGGKAIANVLLGKVNPSGKLPFTYPRHTNALVTYDHKYAEINPIQGSLTSYDPQFSFGSGLSYTQFSYSELKLNTPQLNLGDILQVSIVVTNSGTRQGTEVVQLYLRDEYASITPSYRRLKRFQKIKLEAGAHKTLSFELIPTDLQFVGTDNTWIAEPGTFTVMIHDQEISFELMPDKREAFST